MKTIIAGSRTITDYQSVVDAVKESDFQITEIVCGEADGVDSLGRRYAVENDIKIKSMPADWNNLTVEPCVVRVGRNGKKYNLLAGLNRNKDMANYAEALVLVWDGKSDGSKNMLSLAKERNLKIYQKIVK